VGVSQANFAGAFSVTTTCPSSAAAITAVSATGPNATFRVTGQSQTGHCKATFTGGAGKQGNLAIIVTAAGIIIDSRPQPIPNKRSDLR
jgi:hypothetical protein